MNTVEEQTAADLKDLIHRAAPATKAPEQLATHTLAQAREPQRGTWQTRRPVRRSTKIGASVLAATLAGAVAAATLVGHSDYQKVIHPSENMAPTIAVSQTVLVAKELRPQRGDVVYLNAKRDGDTFATINRVIGLPGDAVSCPATPDGTCKAVVVSGQALNETWQTSKTAPFPQVTVPPGHVFVLGDNRDFAVDSRIYGPQPLDAIIGVVIARYTKTGDREPLPGTPPHQLPDEYSNIDPAGPVPPAGVR